MTDERDEIRARINIVDLVSERVVLKQQGRTWKGLCPFHADKNPSFSVDPRTNRYRCWSCGAHGDIFTWVMKTQTGDDFREALELLAKRAGIELKTRSTESISQRKTQEAAMEEALSFFRSSLPRSSDAIAYCDRRGLSEDVRNLWELGYAPDVGEALATHLKKKGFNLNECRELFLVERDPSGGFFDKFRGRLMFPIRDANGALVAFGGRVLGDGIPKYINSSDTPLYRKSRVLYGLNRAKEHISRSRAAVLVEGYLDVIACHRAGVTGAVASLGTALSEDHAKLLARWCDEATILYDADDAGEKAALRGSEILEAAGIRVKVALLPKGEDPDTLLRQEGPAAVEQTVQRAVGRIDFSLRQLERRLTPEDDEFWDEAVEILAGCSSIIEMDQHIVRLAAAYPGTRDKVLAQRRLQAMVAQRRKALRSPADPGRLPKGSATPQVLKEPMSSDEATIFKALMTELFRNQAWEILREPELMVSSSAVHLTEAILQAFPEAPPQGSPAVWISHIESDDLQDLLAQIEMQEHLLVSEQFLVDAFEKLRKRRSEREYQMVKALPSSDEQLKEIQQRLRNLKSV